MSSSGRSEHLRLVALHDRVCPSWFAAREPRPSGFVRPVQLPGDFPGHEAAALFFAEKWLTRVGSCRVWVWRGIFGAYTVVRVLREETGELSACAFAADNVNPPLRGTPEGVLTESKKCGGPRE